MDLGLDSVGLGLASGRLGWGSVDPGLDSVGLALASVELRLDSMD